jgi:ubiquinone/menaquinone biosynthesis C-methylase UbiE
MTSLTDTKTAPAAEARPSAEYRKFIQGHYDGPAGAFTAVSGFLTGHEALAGRLIRPDGFDVRGCKRILDAACGNGRYMKFLLRNADPDAMLTAFDLSPRMLERARGRVASERVTYAVADLTRLPYGDATFNAIVCGWVLEHLPDPRPGLRELARVLVPGGKLLLLSTENTITGRLCKWMYHCCNAYNREELRRRCGECGLTWEREMWFSRVHRWLRLGGIVVELRRPL